MTLPTITFALIAGYAAQSFIVDFAAKMTAALVGI